MIICKCQFRFIALIQFHPCMRKRRTPFNGYDGGKSGNGTYHNIINHIPPHRIFMTLTAGNCGILKHIREAEWHVVNDIDPDVMRAWDATGLALQGNYDFYNLPVLEFLNTNLHDLKYWRQREHIFIYLDPPYLFDTRKNQMDMYRYEMTEQDHIDLLAAIHLRRDIKIMISHYPCALYNAALADWNYFDFQSITRKGLATERIYYNYDLDGRLHDYRYIGMNFRQREKYKRIKTNLVAKLERMEPVERNSVLYEIMSKFNQK